MKWTIPERIVERGRVYANEGRVTAISQDLAQEVWHAEVIGSQVYRVELDGTPREADVCTCPYWQDKGYCKHTVAVELALRDKGYNRVLKQNKNIKTTYKAPALSKVVTESFAKLQEKETSQHLQESTPLQVEFLVENIVVSNYHPERNVFGLAFKIGFREGRTYVVKNASEFLQSFSRQETYRISEKYHYSLLEQNFSEGDLGLLKQALLIYQTSQMIASNGIQVQGSLKQRSLLLPINEAKPYMLELDRQGKLQLTLTDKVKHIGLCFINWQ